MQFANQIPISLSLIPESQQKRYNWTEIYIEFDTKILSLFEDEIKLNAEKALI